MNSELFRVDGDVAVVTGAGRGIGEGIAKTLASAGAAVVCAARRTNEIERVAKEIRDAGGEAVAVTTDVTKKEDVENLAASAGEHFGSLDIWVNNAGGSPIQANLVDLPEEEWHATLALNLTAVFYGVRAAARHMDETGRIVITSSVASQDIFEGSGHYSACKAGVDMLTRTLSRELAPIRINNILPGLVPTEVMMNALSITDDDLPAVLEGSDIVAGRLGKPEDLGQAVLYFCSQASDWVTGQSLRVAGGP